MKSEDLLENIIMIYSNCFWGVFFLVIAYLVFVGITLYLKKKDESEKGWDNYIFVVKKKVIEVLFGTFLLLIILVFWNEIFPVNPFTLLKPALYWKILFGVWMITNIISGKKLYCELNFREYLREVRKGAYQYTTPENILMGEMEHCNLIYTLQTERLGILKSLTPISLIPLIAGYILKGKNITVDWNWYTVVFFAMIIIYFYNVWKCYSDMKFWKKRAWKIQEELRNMHVKKKSQRICKEERTLKLDKDEDK